MCLHSSSLNDVAICALSGHMPWTNRERGEPFSTESTQPRFPKASAVCRRSPAPPASRGASEAWCWEPCGSRSCILFCVLCRGEECCLKSLLLPSTSHSNAALSVLLVIFYDLGVFGVIWSQDASHPLYLVSLQYKRKLFQRESQVYFNYTLFGPVCLIL